MKSRPLPQRPPRLPAQVNRRQTALLKDRKGLNRCFASLQVVVYHQEARGRHCGAGHAPAGHPAEPGPDRDAHFRHCSPACQLCCINGTGEHPPASGERHRGGESQRRPVRTKADRHACGLQQPCGKMGRGTGFRAPGGVEARNIPPYIFKIRPDACRRVKGREEKTKKAGTKVIDFYPKSAG